VEPPKLKSLHAEGHLSLPKLATFRKLTTEELIESLRPGAVGALKVRPDGTVLDGHHRVCILRERGVDVDLLPREILTTPEREMPGAE
jgi:ParB-like chromosome segregation protein Spo0J